MPYACYRPLRCCIHCKGKHDSEDHHLSLGIPTMLNPDPENLPTAAPPTAITLKQDHTNDRYKMLGAPLLSQKLAYQQWQTTTPHLLLTNSPSPRLMLETMSPISTRMLPTSSTSNPTSDYKDSCCHLRWQPGPSTMRPTNNSPPISATHIRKEQKILHAMHLLIERAKDCNRDVLKLLEETTDNGWNNQAWQA